MRKSKTMSDYDDMVKLIIKRLRKRGFSQVSGYNRFRYMCETEKAIILLREKGTEARIPLAKIAAAIEAVRQEPAIYDKGPSALRKYGITHINSPLWSLLNLLSKAELML